MNKAGRIKNIIDGINFIEEHVHLRFHKTAKEFGLTLDQFHLLVELEELEIKVPDNVGPKISDIASRRNLSQNTISERVTRLEKMNLVVRVKDESDRRISRVKLSTQGKELLKKISNEADSSYVERLLCILDDETIEIMSSSIDKLTTIINSEKQ